MTITIKLFAILRDKAGVSDLRLDLPQSATVSSAIETLVARHPDLKPFAHRIACAVNLDGAGPGTILHDNDELALLPPVSGGRE
jgi:molybdopterin converting factor small subunit